MSFHDIAAEAAMTFARRSELDAGEIGHETQTYGWPDDAPAARQRDPFTLVEVAASGLHVELAVSTADTWAVKVYACVPQWNGTLDYGYALLAAADDSDRRDVLVSDAAILEVAGRALLAAARGDRVIP